jgi:ABC-type antimicrobial peptide transport system permease subunit
MKRALWEKHGQYTASNTAWTSKEKSRQEARKAARIEDCGAGLPMRRPWIRLSSDCSLSNDSGGVVGPAQTIRAALRTVNGGIVVYEVHTMNSVISRSLAARRFSMILLGIFAALALVLSCVGIYGVISYLVGQRTHEIGIRMALGAQRADIFLDVLGQGSRLALVGASLGVVAALGLTRFLTTMLFGVSATDPLAFAIVVALLLAVALLACWIPARRAVHVDPMVALRYE